jgi:acetyl esterase/lipase
MKKLLIITISSLFYIACESTQSSNTPLPSTKLTLPPEKSPVFEISAPGVQFYNNIEYDTLANTQFDIFLPTSETPTPLAILIHGGAFIFGTKAQLYYQEYYTDLINSLLAQNIAVASLGYSLISKEEDQGILKPLNNCKRALQYIRYASEELNIDKKNILMVGNSAGAGTALWIGLSDNQADPSSVDQVLHEDTRLKAIVAFETQASYDLYSWSDEIFAEYQSQGLNTDSILSIIGLQSVYQYTGVQNQEEFQAKNTDTYRSRLNMLELLSPDDPELYISNVNTSYILPNNLNDLYHHPLHAKAIKDQSEKQKVKGLFYIPSMDINTTQGESVQQFILRKLKSEG